MSETLGEALPREIKRCQELLSHYASIGPSGNFGVIMIQAEITAARKAMIESDPVAMLRAFINLKECK